MYPVDEAQTATRPVGNCAGWRAERMMHAIAKASLQADSRIDMFWESMKIDIKSCQNGSQSSPWCALGSFRASKIMKQLDTASQKGPQGCLRASFEAPGAAQERPMLPKERPEGAQERSWKASGDAKSRKSRSHSKKTSILAKVLRDSPLPMRGALWIPRNRSKIKPEGSKVGS